jgi:hypothetical protein
MHQERFISANQFFDDCRLSVCNIFLTPTIKNRLLYFLLTIKVSGIFNLSYPEHERALPICNIPQLFSHLGRKHEFNYLASLPTAGNNSKKKEE